MDLLWADLTPDAARHALRQTLWYLRRRLGTELLAVEGERIALSAPIEFDRDLILACADSGDAEGVVSRYGGEFLGEFAVPGGSEFEQWADVERVRLRLVFQRAAESVAQRCLQAGRLREAIELARRVRDADRMRERGWRLLIETQLAASETLGATFEAEAFERFATAEGITPEPATRAVLRQVRESTARSVDPDGGSSETILAQLVGREREFAAVLAAWERARGGRVARVHIEAPAGHGKTRLLTDVATRLRAARARVVVVRANAGARHVSYALVGELVDALAKLPGAIGISPSAAGALVALNPSLSATYSANADPATGDEALRRRAMALRELVTALAEEQPLAVLTDDLHWCDAPSLSMLRLADAGLDRQRLLIVSTGRPLPEHASQPADADVKLLRLAPLPAAAVGELVGSIASLPAESWAERFVGAITLSSGGSPLLVLETLQLLLERGLLERRAGAWRSSDATTLLDSLVGASAMRERVTLLPEEARTVLLLLSVAGTAMPASRLLRAVTVSHASLDVMLPALERRGYIECRGDRWRVAHDEYATTTMALARDEERAAAEVAIGRAIAVEADIDDREMRQAAAHLRRGGDEATLRVLYGRYVRHARALGDRRSDAELVREFDATATPRQHRLLVRSQPWHYRVGLYSPARVLVALAGAALVIAAGVLGVAFARRERPRADAVLVAVGRDETGGAVVRARRIFASRWDEARELRVEDGSALSSALVEGSVAKVLEPHPIEDAWVTPRSVGDSGVIDLFLLRRGRAERLTTAAGDDESPTWSPDGAHLVFVSSRWNRLSRYDVAVLDTASRAVRQLTSGDDSDTAPVWSPDGSRIAFTRRFWTRRSLELCVIAFDGSDLRCRPIDGFTDLAVIGWPSAREVLLEGTRGDPGTRGGTLLRTALGDEAPRTVLDGVQATRLSPDGRWLVYRSVGAVADHEPWFVIPQDLSRGARPVLVPGLDSGVTRVLWGPGGRPRPFIERLELRSFGSPTVGVGHRLRALAFDRNDARIDAPYLRWHSSDTTIATIDDRGTLRPRRRGTVTVTVSAGGWRSATHTLAIEEGVVDTLLSEAWSRTPPLEQAWLRREDPEWMPYGTPPSSLTRLADGRTALSSNGDASFVSGVYSQSEFPIEHGLALDAAFSVAITLDQWQHLAASLTTALPPAALARWNLQTGVHPDVQGPALCAVAYPGGSEGVEFDGVASARLDDTYRFAVPPHMRTGRWFTVRVQLFPDGRCGIALDGVARWISGRPIEPYRAARIQLEGKAFETTALVGPVLVRRGVPRDIDWSVLDRAARAHRAPDR